MSVPRKETIEKEFKEIRQQYDLQVLKNKFGQTYGEPKLKRQNEMMGSMKSKKRLVISKEEQE